VPKLDVVIPAYGDASRLHRLLDRLDEQASGSGQELTVIVSDDGSPTPLAEALSVQSFSNLSIRVVRGQNGGPGAARNRGVAASSADWIVFLDADTVPEDGWLAELYALLGMDQDVDAYEGRVSVPSDEATPFSHATAIRADVAHGGANIIYRRKSLLHIGGFSESFYDSRRRMHFREDIELYFRALDAGLRIVPAPQLSVSHPPLESSFLTPFRLARRYYFDALLDRQHATRFREVNQARRVGPVSLRAARHAAAVSHIAAIAITLTGVVSGSRRVARPGGVLSIVAWSANGAALAWGKEVRATQLGSLAAASFGTPWVYVWHYYRGVVAFRHRPRLR
jgi:glycosyltransferase involved in cell wall biosynthesis